MLAGLTGEDGHRSPLGNPPARRRHAAGQRLERGLNLPTLPSLMIAGRTREDGGVQHVVARGTEDRSDEAENE